MVPPILPIIGRAVKRSIMFQDGAYKNGGADVVVETAEVEPGILRFTATPRAFETPTRHYPRALVSQGGGKIRHPLALDVFGTERLSCGA